MEEFVLLKKILKKAYKNMSEYKVKYYICFSIKPSRMLSAAKH